MQTPNGQNKFDNKPSLQHVEQEFIENLRLHGIDQIATSLQMIHDMALYHSDCSINDREKIALYDLKVLWEGVLGLEG